MTSQQKLEASLKTLEGLNCWHVNSGGVAGTTFSLALGGKIPRQLPLSNPTASEEYRQFEGEHNLYVWCSWRLIDENGTMTSSYRPVFEAAKLKLLTNQVICGALLNSQTLDLELRFEHSRLDLFCDHVFAKSSHDCNYELHSIDRVLVIGPGCSVDETQV